jgi:hypothetical protein
MGRPSSVALRELPEPPPLPEGSQEEQSGWGVHPVCWDSKQWATSVLPVDLAAFFTQNWI